MALGSSGCGGLTAIDPSQHSLYPAYASHGGDTFGRAGLPEFFARPGIKNRVRTQTDWRGIASHYGYDGRGNRTSMQRAGIEERWSFDDRGDVLGWTDAEGRRTAYSWDAYGLPRTVVHPDGTIERSEHDVRGRLLRQIDGNGGVTAYTYDGHDRPVEIRWPATAAGVGTRTVVYDDAANTRIEYDEHDRPTTYVHDRQGRLRFVRDALDQEREQRYDAHGNLEYERDYAGNETVHVHDAGDRRIRTLAPEGRRSQWAYDAVGNVLRETLDRDDGEQVRSTEFAYEHARYQRTQVRQRLDGRWLTTQIEPDGNGNVVATTDPLGRTIQTDYDAFDRPIEIREPLGKTTVYTYDGVGNRTQERRHLGENQWQVRSYRYDDRNREIERSDAEGGVWTSAYDGNGNVTRRTDPLGHASVLVYDARNQLVEQRGPVEGQRTTYSYDLAGNRVGEVQPSGNEISHHYDELNRRTATTDTVGPVESMTYTANGQVQTRTGGRGHTVTFVHDGLDQVIEERQPLNRTITRTYTVHGEVESHSDGEGNTTIHAYDELGRRIGTIHPEPLGYIESWSHDDAGNVLSHSNRRGHTTSYAYNDLNQRTGQSDPSPPGTSQSWTYDPLGTVLTHTDRRGIVTAHQHDREHRPTALIRDGVLRQTQSHDAAGRLASRSDALGNTTFYDYDAAGRTLRERRPGGATAHWTYTPADDVATATDPDGITTRYTYDERRRVIAEEDGEGHETRYGYDLDDQRTEVIRPKGSAHTWSYDYDEAGRLTEVSGPAGVAASYDYDLADNRTSQTDANGQTTTFGYDALNRLTTITYPSVNGVAAIETFELDGNGNIEVHDNGGVVTTTAIYDALDRKTGESYTPVAADGLTAIAYGYDDNGNLRQVTETFQTGDPKTSTYAYDPQERLIARTDRHGRSLSQTFDAEGNRTRRTGPDGQARYAYNARNQLTLVTPPGQGGIEVQPSPAGRLRGLVHGNGVTTTITHDNAGRLTQIAHSAGGGTVASAAYVLDPHGNRTEEAITQGTNTRVVGYGYDAADRLTRITAPEAETNYELDGTGNREIETVTIGGTPAGTKTYTYDARNQLTDIDDTAGPIQVFTYDAAGRQITKSIGAQTWTQAWSAKDRLLTLTLGGGPPQVTYEYDAAGQRSARDADGQRRHYLWDGLNLHAETNAVGNVLASYSHAGRHALSAAHGSERSHYHTDALGTPLAITAATGTIAVRYQTDAWGVEQSASAAHPNPIGFTGYLKDPATDDLYAQARQYHPATGRFTSRDELRGDPLIPLSQHRYLYAIGNPTVYVDPDGRCYGNAELVLSPYECTQMTAEMLGVDASTREGVRAVAEHDLGIAKAQAGAMLTMGGGLALARGTYSAARSVAEAWRMGGWRLAVAEAAPTAAMSAETAAVVGLSATGLGEAPPTPLSGPITSARRVVSRFAGEGADAVQATRAASLHADVPLLTHEPINPRNLPVPVSSARSAADRGQALTSVEGPGLHGLVANTAPRLDYSPRFADDLTNFNPGYSHFAGKIEDDMLLVQFHRSDRALGQGRSAAWWTTPDSANPLMTIDDVRQGFALPPGWGPRDAVSVARIPQGTEVEFFRGTALRQIENATIYQGGGLQFRFKDFDESWIIQTRKIPGAQ